MKIKKLRISGIGGIKELECSFQDNFNVLCGANGVGKTTILNIIVDGFSVGASILKRNRNYEVGNYEINFIDNSEKEYNKTFLVKEFDPDKQETRIVTNDFSSYIMLFNINRIIVRILFCERHLHAILATPFRAKSVTSLLAL